MCVSAHSKFRHSCRGFCVHARAFACASVLFTPANTDDDDTYAYITLHMKRTLFACVGCVRECLFAAHTTHCDAYLVACLCVCVCFCINCIQLDGIGVRYTHTDKMARNQYGNVGQRTNAPTNRHTIGVRPLDDVRALSVCVCVWVRTNIYAHMAMMRYGWIIPEMC